MQTCGNKILAAVKAVAAYANIELAKARLRLELIARGLKPSCVWGTAVVALLKERAIINRELNHYGPYSRMTQRFS